MAPLLTIVESFVPFKPSRALLSPAPQGPEIQSSWQLSWEVPREACIFLRTDTDFLLGFTLFDFYFLSQKSELSFSAT